MTLLMTFYDNVSNFHVVCLVCTVCCVKTEGTDVFIDYIHVHVKKLDLYKMFL